jgi:hypothetical protein
MSPIVQTRRGQNIGCLSKNFRTVLQKVVSTVVRAPLIKGWALVHDRALVGRVTHARNVPVLVQRRGTEPPPVLTESSVIRDLARSRIPSGVYVVKVNPTKLDLAVARVVPNDLSDSHSAFALPTCMGLRREAHNQQEK